MRAVDRQIMGAFAWRCGCVMPCCTRPAASSWPAARARWAGWARAARGFRIQPLTPARCSDIQRESKKTELSIKECAKRGDRRSMSVLALELLRTRKAVSRLHTSKAQMNSVSLHLNENLGAQREQGQQLRSRGPPLLARPRPAHGPPCPLTPSPFPQRSTRRWARCTRAAS